MRKKIPIEVSARHIHLSRADVDKLFGQDYQLKELRRLGQPYEFAAQEILVIKSGDKFINNVRVVGPERERTQVEISLTDAVGLGIQVPLRLSGDVNGSSPVVIIGPNCQIELKEGLIIAKRHLHCAVDEAKKLKLKNGDIVSARVSGPRETVFHQIIVRAGKGYKLCLHLDTDEGNAAGISKMGQGELIK